SGHVLNAPLYAKAGGDDQGNRYLISSPRTAFEGTLMPWCKPRNPRNLFPRVCQDRKDKDWPHGPSAGTPGGYARSRTETVYGAREAPRFEHPRCWNI